MAMDIAALLAKLIREREFQAISGNLITQWGPSDRVLIGANYLPPRNMTKNADTIERVHWRTIAASDGTRHSPAQLVDGGEYFGKIHYRFGHSDIARQFTAADYDALVNYLNRNMSMQASAMVIGWTEDVLVQALAEHDELAIWEAILHLTQTRRGDNGYFEYEEVTGIADHRVAAAGDWSDPAHDPWTEDIFPRVKALTDQGFSKAGIRMVFTDQVRTLLMNNPFTATRAGNSVLVTNGAGVVSSAAVNGPVDETKLNSIFAANGLGTPVVNDTWVPTRTGQKRAFDEGSMAFIASTGRAERVRFNEANPSDVKVVTNTVGFLGIGVANGMQTPGRQVRVRAFTDQKDARLEGEAWQTSGPVIEDAEAIKVLYGIE